MRALSSGIWLSVTNNQQSNHPTHPDQTINDPTADNDLLTNGQNNVQSISGTDSGYQSACGSRQKAILVDGYTQMVTDRIQEGWSCHLVTILFSQFPGPRSAVIDRMKDEVQRVYSTLLTRVHRKPRTAPIDELPILVGAADLPVYKRDRTSIATDFCNGGLHFHAVLLLPPRSRLQGSLVGHFEGNRDLYGGPGTPIRRIHVKPVDTDPGRVVDYFLKTVLNGRLSYDEAVLVLPRARGELESPQPSSRSAGIGTSDMTQRCSCSTLRRGKAKPLTKPRSPTSVIASGRRLPSSIPARRLTSFRLQPSKEGEARMSP